MALEFLWGYILYYVYYTVYKLEHMVAILV
jgi:hypothetical protein